MISFNTLFGFKKILRVGKAILRKGGELIGSDSIVADSKFFFTEYLLYRGDALYYWVLGTCTWVVFAVFLVYGMQLIILIRAL